MYSYLGVMLTWWQRKIILVAASKSIVGRFCLKQPEEKDAMKVGLFPGELFLQLMSTTVDTGVDNFMREF